jgi:hypothetical protein
MLNVSVMTVWIIKKKQIIPFIENSVDSQKSIRYYEGVVPVTDSLRGTVGG